MDSLLIPDTDHGGHLECAPNGGIRAGEHLQVKLHMRQPGNWTAMDLDRSEVLDLYHFLGEWLMAVNHIDTDAHPMHETPDATVDGYDWPQGEYTTELGGQVFTQAQWEAVQTWRDGTVQPLRGTPSGDSVALEAHAAVYGDRQADYGHPREDFTRTAIIWTGLLHHKLAEGAFIDAEDVPRLQIGVKLARDVHSPKRDNRVDMAGYAITLDQLETGQ